VQTRAATRYQASSPAHGGCLASLQARSACKVPARVIPIELVDDGDDAQDIGAVANGGKGPVHAPADETADGPGTEQVPSKAAAAEHAAVAEGSRPSPSMVAGSSAGVSPTALGTCPASPAALAVRRMQLGIDLLRRGCARDALGHFSQANEVWPVDARVLLWRASAMMHLPEDEAAVGALRDCGQAVLLASDNTTLAAAFELRGHMRQLLGDSQGANIDSTVCGRLIAAQGDSFCFDMPLTLLTACHCPAGPAVDASQANAVAHAAGHVQDAAGPLTLHAVRIE
jgi:hypothetical protein